jgi:hypothetical protein
MKPDDWKWIAIFALSEIGMIAWLIWRDIRDEYYDGLTRYDEDE